MHDYGIAVKLVDKAAIVTASGRIDSSNAGVFEKVLENTISGGYFVLILDLGELINLTSAGLRVILKVMKECKQRNGDLRIANVPQRITELFALIGFTIQTYEDVSSAMENL